MTEYIRKQDAVNSVECANGNITWAERDDCKKRLEELSPADVAPVVHGKWIPQKENYEFKEAWMKCSACGYPVSRWTGNTNFCPNCGARMGGEREE